MAELSPGVRWDDRGEEAIGFVGKEERRGEWRGGAGGGEERWKEMGNEEQVLPPAGLRDKYLQNWNKPPGD